MRSQKRVPLGNKSVSKTRTLRQKVGVEASKTCTVRQKVRQKHVPLGKKSAMASSHLGQTLNPKVRPREIGERQKHVPLGKKCVKNAYP